MIKDNELYNFNFNLYGTDAASLVVELSAIARLFHVQAEQAASEGDAYASCRLTDRAIACEFVSFQLSKKVKALDVLNGEENV